MGSTSRLRRANSLGLIGPNGAGKTSLLRLLALLARPDAGSITFDQVPAQAIPIRERARSLAFLAQGDDVHWPIKVERLVALGRLPHRGSGGETEADRVAIDRALAAAGIADLRDRTVDTLSGGERARALIARALAVEAPILLADEPTAALDPYHQLQIMELLRSTARAGAGVAVVLHDLSLASRFCDRLVLLAEGRTLADGAPADVLTDAHLATAYGIEVLRGRRDGEDYLLPWRKLEERH